MKCTHCETDSTYKDRQANRQSCKQCRHPFAFEPKTDALQMSDPLFARTIKEVSADGTLSFTSRQLWYEVNRRLLARKSLSCGASALLILIGSGLLYQLRHTAPTLVAVFGLMMAVLPKKSKPKGPRYPKLSYELFDRSYLQRWVVTHGKITKMLPPSHADKQTGTGSGFRGRTRPEATEAQDLLGYSFDRALVVEHADTAAMLVANHFHFENNCAILSLDGYPFGTADTIKTMLARNASLKVFALHDATMSGCRMTQLLRRPEWFPETSVRLIDLGLRPLHVLKGDLIMLQGAPLRFQIGTTSTSLNAEEIAWLEQGNRAELSALRPHKLMRAIYQGFARAGQTDSGNVGSDGILVVDSGPSIWVYDSGADVYAADSFG
jgi:hypothetical protein